MATLRQGGAWKWCCDWLPCLFHNTFVQTPNSKHYKHSCSQKFPMSFASKVRIQQDGNGAVNFFEFAQWAGPRLGSLAALGWRLLSFPCSVIFWCGLAACGCLANFAPTKETYSSHLDASRWRPATVGLGLGVDHLFKQRACGAISCPCHGFCPMETSVRCPGHCEEILGWTWSPKPCLSQYADGLCVRIFFSEQDTVGVRFFQCFQASKCWTTHPCVCCASISCNAYPFVLSTARVSKTWKNKNNRESMSDTRILQKPWKTKKQKKTKRENLCISKTSKNQKNQKGEPMYIQNLEKPKKNQKKKQKGQNLCKTKKSQCLAWGQYFCFFCFFGFPR